MKTQSTLILGTTVAIATAIIVYSIIQNNARPKVKASPSRLISYSEVQEKLDELATLLQHTRDAAREQRQQAKSERIRINDALQSLDSKVEALEAVIAADRYDPIISNNLEKSTSTEISENEDFVNQRSMTLSDDHVASWIDETLLAGNVNWVLTELAKEETKTSFGSNPSVIVEEILCTEDVCRATLLREGGESLMFEDFVGYPPFTTDGFTVNQPDGRVLLYFTQPGVTIDEIRGDALEGARWGAY